MCGYVHMSTTVCGGQKRAVELWSYESPDMAAGNLNLGPIRAACTVDHLVIFPAPEAYF